MQHPHFFSKRDWRGPECGAGSPVGKCLPGRDQRAEGAGTKSPVRAAFMVNPVSLFINPLTQGPPEHNLGYIPSILTCLSLQSLSGAR